MKFFHKSSHLSEFPLEQYTPVMRVSICTGEKTAGFRDKKTGQIKEVMLIKTEKDIAEFREKYGVTEKIEKVY